MLATLLVLAILAFIWFTYNRLVRFRQLLAEAWSDIDVQLKRRRDLIPALVESVKGYSRHELGTLESITGLRNAGLASDSRPLREAAEKTLAGDMRKIMALVEAYPDLKADKNFRKLHESLVAIEDDLQSARRYYNGCVRNLNISIQSFPGNLIASGFGFQNENFFELEYATERSNPDVRF